MLRSGGVLGRRYGGVYRKAPWWPSYRRPARFVEPAAASGGTVSGDLPTVTVTAPTGAGSAAGRGTGVGDLPTVTVSAPTGVSTGGGVASVGLPTVAIVAPAGAATGGDVAAGDLPTVLINAPLGLATGGGVAAGALPTVLITAPGGAGGTPTGVLDWTLSIRGGYRWSVIIRDRT